MHVGAGSSAQASPLILVCLPALQEPVVHAAAGRPRAAAAVLVEGFLRGQTRSRIPPPKTLEARRAGRIPDGFHGDRCVRSSQISSASFSANCELEIGVTMLSRAP